MGSGSACGPAALTPRAPATLALSQQQHQRAACLASIVHNLDTGAAQIHYTEPLFKLKQWLSPCFITFSQQHDFTLVDWGSDVDAYFEQKKNGAHDIDSEVAVWFPYLPQAAQHTQTHTRKDLRQVEEQSRLTDTIVHMLRHRHNGQSHFCLIVWGMRTL